MILIYTRARTHTRRYHHYHYHRTGHFPRATDSRRLSLAHGPRHRIRVAHNTQCIIYCDTRGTARIMYASARGGPTPRLGETVGTVVVVCDAKDRGGFPFARRRTEYTVGGVRYPGTGRTASAIQRPRTSHTSISTGVAKN